MGIETERNALYKNMENVTGTFFKKMLIRNSVVYEVLQV